MKATEDQRRSLTLPNYFKQVGRLEEDEHPIDLAVRRRMPQLAAKKRRLGRLQRRVLAQLGNDTKAFNDLETLRNEVSGERDEAYFNVGYDHGHAEGVARAHRPAPYKRARELARNLRERLAQAQISRAEAALVLLECLRAVLSGDDARPESHLTLKASAAPAMTTNGADSNSGSRHRSPARKSARRQANGHDLPR